jgi:hypothetical protein
MKNKIQEIKDEAIENEPFDGILTSLVYTEKVLKEAVERAKVEKIYGYLGQSITRVNKKSILKIIKELK